MKRSLPGATRVARVKSAQSQLKSTAVCLVPPNPGLPRKPGAAITRDLAMVEI